MSDKLNPSKNGRYRVTLQFHVKLNEKDVDQYDEWVEWLDGEWLLDELTGRCNVAKVLYEEG